MSKKLKLVFLVSLVLNLVLLGVIVGRVPRGLERHLTRRDRLEEKLKALPEEAQARFRERFAQIRAAGEPLRKEMDAARREALSLMSAQTFDQAAYDRQVEKILELRDELFKRISAAVEQTVKDLSPEERRTFADLLRPPSPSPK